MPYAEFKGASALISGAAGGIGRATAIAFAEAGCNLVLTDRNEAGLAQVEDAARRHGVKIVAIAGDITDDALHARLVAAAVEGHGALDYAFNNAGVSPAAVPTDAQAEQDVDAILGVNLRSIWSAIRHQLPAMKARGRGAIVNTASALGLVGGEGRAVYTASKHGVIGLTRSVALEAGPHGIRVNAVCPGAIETEMIADVIGALKADSAMMESFQAIQPLRRWGQPEEIAEAALWLCSSRSSFVNGHALVVDGGYSVQ